MARPRRNTRAETAESLPATMLPQPLPVSNGAERKGMTIQGVIDPDLHAYLRLFATATGKTNIEAIEWMIANTSKQHPIQLPKIQL